MGWDLRVGCLFVPPVRNCCLLSLNNLVLKWVMVKLTKIKHILNPLPRCIQPNLKMHRERWIHWESVSCSLVWKAGVQGRGRAFFKTLWIVTVRWAMHRYVGVICCHLDRLACRGFVMTRMQCWWRCVVTRVFSCSCLLTLFLLYCVSVSLSKQRSLFVSPS